MGREWLRKRVFFGQFFAGFAGDQQRLEPINFLQRNGVSCLGALEAARSFVKLLLRDQIVFVHLLRAAVFVIGVKQVRFRALHGGNLFWISRRGIGWADA